MSKIESLKAQAENLKAALAEQGIEITRGVALDTVAKQYGFANWDTLSGVLNQPVTAAPKPTLKDLAYYPMHAWVEKGAQTQSYNVEGYEEEGLALLGDEKALSGFLAKYPDSFSKGLDSEAMYLLGSGHDVSFTFRDLLGLEYKELGGKGYWALKDGDRFIRFDSEPVILPVKTVEMTVPKVVRTIKGTELIAMRSHDGSDSDRFVMVPPHLKLEVIRSKISKGLTELKAAVSDADAGVAVEDVEKMVKNLGCLWVQRPHEVGQNYDL